MNAGMTTQEVIAGVDAQDIADVLGCELAEAEKIHAAAVSEFHKIAGSTP